MDAQRLEWLLDRYFDQALAVDEKAELEHLLLSSAQARQVFWDRAQLHGSLRQWGEEKWGAGAPYLNLPFAQESPRGIGEVSAGQAPRSPLRQRFFWAAAALSAIAAALLVAWAPYWRSAPEAGPVEDGAPEAMATAEPETEAEATDNSIAVLLEAPGAQWQDTGAPTLPGSLLSAGRLLLESGTAYIQFYSGATVVLEGPADFELISVNEAFCTRGKVRANVPPQAVGFVIRSPQLDLVDLGTEFGMEVAEGKKTDVHVFEGKVELYDPGRKGKSPPRKELTAGSGYSLDAAGSPSDIASDPAAFVSARDVEAQSEDAASQRREFWLAASEALRADNRLLLYYTFQTDDPLERTLKNQAPAQVQISTDGAIVGCQWTRGRWPGKQALEFKRPGDRVLIDLPGEYESLTFMTWVRIDGLDNRFNGLLLSEGWEKGNLHWQVNNKGSVVLSVRGRNLDLENHSVTRPAFGSRAFGRWAHLTLVYDFPAKTIRHYMNARLTLETPFVAPRKIKLGRLVLGNWGIQPSSEKNPIRNLNGRIDEFLLFKAALDPEEIKSLYEAGKPTS